MKTDGTSGHNYYFMNIRSVLLVLSMIIISQEGYTGKGDSAEPVTISQWRPYDISLIAEQDHPWWTFPVEANFIHEESQSIIAIEAFWNGGREWVIRFAPTLPGFWRYATTSTDPGLNGCTDTIEVREPTSDEIASNPNYRGHLSISPNKRYFQYADGTPFFLMASTLWAGNTARCGLGSNQDGPFFQYLSDRKSKGITTILMQLFHGYGDYPNSPGHRNEGGKTFFDDSLTQLNPDHFHYLDKRMQAIWERGLAVASPTTWFGKTNRPLFTIKDAKRVSSYCMVRYGVYNGIWALSGEYQYNFRDCGWTAEDINELGREVQKHNPYRHPLSIHPSGRTDWDPPHNVQSSRPFHEETWLDHHWLQTGQSIDRLYNIVVRAKENRALVPTKPVFCSETYYERASDSDGAYTTRWEAWTAYLSGCAGFGYGAFGIWQFYDPDDPHGEPGKKTRDVVPWKQAIEFEGVTMLKHVKALLTSIDWWRLEPKREDLLVDGKPCPTPTSKDISPPHAAAVPGKLWIVYIPRGNEGRGIALSETFRDKKLTGRWYNPRTGAWVKKDGSFILKKGRIPSRPNPSDEDWVIVIQIGTG